MARITRVAAHGSLEEVKSSLQNDPRKAEEIAKHCGVSKATVHLHDQLASFSHGILARLVSISLQA